MQLFTDFRYAEAARQQHDVVFVQTARAILADLAERLSRRIGFEADHVTYAGWETLGSGGLDVVPRRGLVEGLRAVKDADELQRMRAAAAATATARMYASPGSASQGGARSSSRGHDGAAPEEGADGVAFPRHRRLGPDRRAPARPPGRPGRRAGRDGRRGRRRARRRVLLRLHANVRDGRLPDETAARIRRLPAGSTGRARRDAHRRRGGAADAVARGIIDATEFAGLFGHGLGHGVGMDVHEAPVARPESTDTLAPHSVLGCEPGIYLPGEGGIRIEDLVVVTAGAGRPRVLHGFTRSSSRSHDRWIRPRRPAAASYRTFADRGTPPSVDETAAALGSSAGDVAAAYRRLADAHAFVLAAGSLDVRLASPFSAVPTAFRVESERGAWWGSCV